MDYPGPYCKAAGVSCESLTHNSLKLLEKLTNGIVLEVSTYCQKQKLNINNLQRILGSLCENVQNVSSNTVQTKIRRLHEKKKILASKRKVSCIQELLEAPFEPPVPTPCPIMDVIHDRITLPSMECSKSSIALTPALVSDTEPQRDQENAPLDNSPSYSVARDVEVQQGGHVCNNSRKDCNFSEYLLNKQQRKLKHLTQVTTEKENLIDSMNKRLGHYSVKNVNKRDLAAKTNLNHLRNLRGSDRNLRKKLKKQTELVGASQQKIQDLENANSEISEKYHNLLTKHKADKTKKVTVQKNNSKLKKKVLSIKASSSNTSVVFDQQSEIRATVTSLNNQLIEKDEIICELDHKVNELKKENPLKIETKSKDGSYTEDIRLCVIQLAGLEVAVEKVMPVINVVSQNLFKTTFEQNELPTSSTVQTIVDEGHFLAKTFLAEKLNECEHWGINRDGTTRRKQKLLDTSVTLDTGEIVSLGFTHVAKETAETITTVTKNHLREMADMQSKGSDQQISEEFISDSLRKLAFTMSDRASNEKLADKLLNNWRDHVLSQCDSDKQKTTVKNFHCMAHVLLGFHKYICDDVKVYQRSVVDVNGPLGRDKLPVFKFWSKKGTFVERVIRTTADTFGPVGDHHGIRDRWESHCAENGIKSLIGNYKDNRFNGLFQTAAEILVHHKEFLVVLDTVKTPNLKLQAVKADLESDLIHGMLIGLGIIFIRITGPYWNLMTCGKIPYVKLFPYIRGLHKYLSMCSEDPRLLFTNRWLLEDYDIQHHSTYRGVLDVELCDLKASELMCRSMIRVIDKQLVDFLPGGQFSLQPDDVTLKSTSFAQVNNLGCEHHFGDLDSSQKRRPNASIHHHSSIQLLKRNRQRLKDWFATMSKDERQAKWKHARHGGKELRAKHREHEKSVRRDIYDEMNKPKPVPKRRKKDKVEQLQVAELDDTENMSDNTNHNELNRLVNILPDVDNLNVGEYIVVAYQDRWYPGIITEINDTDNLTVKFLSPSRAPSIFMWPNREDIQVVKREFILACKLNPKNNSSRRQSQLEFTEHVYFSELYDHFRNVFF